MLSFITIYSFLSFIAVADAYTTFDTTCAIPAKTTSYVSPPNSRGTLNILWTCLFTIYACTWAIQHLNVPKQREGRESGWKDNLMWKIRGFETSLKWMLATIIAPEILLAKAWSDLDVARKQLEKFKPWAADDDVEWTLTHTLFANMGGFVIRSNPPSYDNQDIEANASVAIDLLGGQPPQIPLAEVLAPLMESSIGCVSSDTNDASTRVNISNSDAVVGQQFNYPNPYHLTAKQLLSLRRCDYIRLPNITLDEINDKSKSDTFVRLTAVAQFLWIVAQIIVRAVEGLVISQLEIAVVAFSTCAVLIYILNWSKPKGVLVPFTILHYEGAIPTEMLEFMRKDLDRSSMSTIMLNADCQSITSGDPIPNDAIYSYDDAWLIGFEFGSIVFGCIHVAAWNFVFPTRIEQILWWSTSIWCTVFVLIYTLIPYCGMICFGDFKSIATPKELAWGAAPLFFLYALARIFLVVEMFRSLCYLPPSAFIATELLNIPHIG
ncbi:hypothetical protein SBOR_7282 [Sclerotinia borealis F-4128]|uniref:Uncharacterized protein n=1 Tax=Sclerotinia borealis (strain F-4128) TaxID=1432307 RepID=W9C973_SCLBF|nr:hypothetical protein SBOR_7282 [Sclerotinia borealis F-4128]